MENYFVQLFPSHDKFSFAHFYLILFYLNDFPLTFLGVNPIFIQPISFKNWLLFVLICIWYDLLFIFSFQIVQHWVLYPYILVFFVVYQYVFYLNHCILMNFTNFFIVLIDSYFTGVMFPFISVCSIACLGLQDLSLICRSICLSRLLLCICLSNTCYINIPYFFRNIGVFCNIFNDIFFWISIAIYIYHWFKWVNLVCLSNIFWR